MRRSNVIGCLFAPKGGGKSTLAREIIREHPRVTILDAHGEYGPDDDDPLQGCEVAWERDDCVALMLEAKDRPRFCISLRVSDDEEALALWTVLWEIPDQLIVIEEASRFCSPQSKPREVSRVLNFGRHRGLSQLYIAQRPSMVHRDVTANADYLAVFRLQEPRDLKYLEQFYGREIDQLRTLPKYRVLVLGVDAMKKVPVAVAKRAVGRTQTRLDLTPEDS